MMKWEKFNWVSRFWCFVRKHAPNSYNNNTTDTRAERAPAPGESKRENGKEQNGGPAGAQLSTVERKKTPRQTNKNHFNLEKESE